MSAFDLMMGNDAYLKPTEYLRQFLGWYRYAGGLH